MDKLLVLTLTALVVVLGVFVQNAYGLDCKVCYVDNNNKSDPAANSCQTMPCNSKDDLIKSFVVRWKAQTGNDTTEADMAKMTAGLVANQFTCSRSVNKIHGVTMIVSMCSALAQYPPSDTAYTTTNYVTAVGEDGKPAIKKYTGQLFICDEAKGIGKNCGPDPDLTLPPKEEKTG